MGPMHCCRAAVGGCTTLLNAGNLRAHGPESRTAGARCQREVPETWATGWPRRSVLNGVAAEALKDAASHAAANMGDAEELRKAARRGNFQRVTKLLASCDDLHYTDGSGYTALHWASHNGHVAVVQALLNKGADVLYCNRYGEMPLHLAAWMGHVAVMDELLSHGADLHCPARSGSTAMHLAAHEGRVAAVEALLAGGADLHCTTKDKRTALHCAAQNGHVTVVQTLLAQGADVHRTTSGGETPLHFAARKHENSAALALWRAGADPFQPNDEGETPLSLLPEHSDVAEQMRTARRQQLAPYSSQALTDLQQLWLQAKTSAITPQQLLTALNPEHISSFSDFVLAHHLLLVAVRQRVLTYSELATFGGNRDYLLENVYLPVTTFCLSDEQKFWLSGLLSYAERRRFIRDGHAVLVKVVADLRSEIRQARLEMESVLVSVAREINSLDSRVSALEQWTEQAARGFQHLCKGQQQMLSDMKDFAVCLQQLYSLLEKQQRNSKIAGLLSFCLSMFPVAGGVLSGASFAAKEVAFGFTVGDVISGTTSVAKEILAVDISDFQTVSVLISDEYISNLDPVARERVEAVVEQTDFKTLPNLQQRLSVVVEELKDSNDFDEPAEDEMEAELHRRFTVLASGSHSDEQTVPAQEAISELQHILQRHLSLTGANVTVDEGDAGDIVTEQMNDTGLLDLDAFVKSFRELERKHPFVRRQREPPELRQRFQNATGSKDVLIIKLAKRLLRALFDKSGSEADSLKSSLSFTRTNNEWNEAEVDALLADHRRDRNVIDEEGFVKVGMKVLFVEKKSNSQAGSHETLGPGFHERNQCVLDS